MNLKNPLTFFIALFLYSFITTAASAAGEFSTSYTTTYTVDNKGETHVTQEVTLTNLVSDLYASEYTLTIGTPAITNIKAQDDLGPLETEVKKTDDSTSIKLLFNQEVVGVGRELKWKLEYDSPDTAAKSGQVWEISVPRIARHEEIISYNTSLVVPKEFGPEMYVAPRAATRQQTDHTYVYSFTKEQLEEGGISAAFGEHQIFEYSLNYHLKNDNLMAISQEIPLPPDIPGRQQVVYTNLEPPPDKMTVDADGNYLASYTLRGKKGLDITLDGYAFIFNREIEPASGGRMENIPQNLVSLYTHSKKYWETENQEIRAKAQELLDPQKTVSENAKSIYDFVTTFLTYNKEKADQGVFERLGALEGLRNPTQAICMEFTDLFIALCRANGIPARELNGYAYTANSRLKPLSVRLGSYDILHAWAEFYDPNFGWVPVDPTWASTTNGLNYFSKLDTNHLVFVIHGSDSEMPYPAGSYKTNDGQKEDVRVGFASEGDIPSSEPSFEAELDAPRFIIAGISAKAMVKIKNNRGVSMFNVRAFSEENELLEGSEGENVIAVIPPYAEEEIKIKTNPKGLFKGGKADLKVTLAYEDFEGRPRTEELSETINVRPVYIVSSPVLILLAAFLAAASIFRLAGFSLRLRNRQNTSKVRT